MFIDDKLIARQESLKPPIRKSLAPISSTSKVDPKRPIHQRAESEADRGSMRRHKPKQDALPRQVTANGPSLDEQPHPPGEEGSVTMPLEEYKSMVRELHKLRELETIINQACSFSVKELTREQVRYMMTIHKNKMIHLLHHQTQQTRAEASNLPLSQLDQLYREYVVDDFIVEE